MADKQRNIANKLSSIIFLENTNNLKYNFCLLISGVIGLFGILAILSTLVEGLSPWGINNRISWGFAIVNFVFWIGIGHAGTLISAILFLLNQGWRVKYHRVAELMTIISVMIAATFPLIHTGRPWFSSYWLIPYYNQMGLMPNFKSPLTWDIFAIFTYFIISCIFFYIGLLPELAILKNKSGNPLLNRFYSILTSFWSGTKEQWEQYRVLYLILAGLATPLVISVHSIVSYDFYVTVIPAWHSAVLPPYFVVGAIFSGLAMVNIIFLLFNKLTNSPDSTFKYMEKINKLILFSSLAISFVYLLELSTYFVDNSWKSSFLPINNGGLLVYLMLISNSIIPLLFVIKRIRGNRLISFLISISILLGMWIERYIIVIKGQELSTSDVNNHLLYSPTFIDYALLVGSIGIFIFFFLLAGKFIPLIPITEEQSHE